MITVGLRIAAAILLFACAIPIFYSEATEFYKGKALGIEISKSCQLSDHCVKYADIAYLDNSNPRYFGALREDGTRVISPYTDMYKSLGFTKDFTVMVDPPPNTKMHMPTITIDTQIPAFFLTSQMTVSDVKEKGLYHATQSIRSVSHTRFVSDTCTEAVITSQDWKPILEDTIVYMENNCNPKYTNIKTVSNIVKDKVEHNIAESYKKKLDDYYSYVKKNCLDTKLSCAPPNDPNLLDENQVTLLPKISPAEKNHYMVRLSG